MKKSLALLVCFLMFFFSTFNASAQCSMCTVNAEMGAKNGNTQTKGINTGVLYLLVIPYVLLAGVGVVWYRNYRKRVVGNPFS